MTEILLHYKTNYRNKIINVVVSTEYSSQMLLRVLATFLFT